jgi:hypothetical protein
MSQFEEYSSYQESFDGNAALRYDEDFPLPQGLPLPTKVRTVEKSGEDVDAQILQLPELKEKLSTKLLSLDQLKPPEGIATGIDVIDDFLLWRGIPKGDLTLLSGKPGTGATSLWLQTAAKVQTEKKWVAWVNSDWELLPSSLQKKNINLKKLLVVKKPADQAQLFWILQEMMTSSLFEMIGCHITEGTLKAHQLQKLKKMARTHKVALVFLSPGKQWTHQSLFSLVIECQGDFFTVRRAAHRPTPFTIPGGLVHADLMSQLTTNSRSLLR